MKAGYILPAVVILVLSACGAKTTLSYTVHVRAPDSAKATELFRASEAVMTRRLAGATIQGGKVTVIPTGSDSATMTLELPDADAALKAQDILLEPFTFDMRIMKSAPDIKTGAPGEWIPTALTGSSIEWIDVIGDIKTGEISLELELTQSGRTILASVFTDNAGKNLGIFVRGLLVSQIAIGTSPVTDRIVISGIPSAKVAEIFADDVNVGLRTTFTPLP